uniref:Ubiquitin-like domain-containing protein n=1 Tax=Tetradesmus obliquus TaxID=3088 RepID=A0A383WA06_TETOB|eukprot:jgi/Sobl393_1/8648/SZX74030.1
MSAEDVKRESKTLNLSIKNQTNEEFHFKVKLSTKLHKVFEAYNARKGVDPGAYRFVFEGNRIAGDTAPAEVSHAGAGCSKLAVVEQHAVSPWLEF